MRRLVLVTSFFSIVFIRATKKERFRPLHSLLQKTYSATHSQLKCLKIYLVLWKQHWVLGTFPFMNIFFTSIILNLVTFFSIDHIAFWFFVTFAFEVIHFIYEEYITECSSKLTLDLESLTIILIFLMECSGSTGETVRLSTLQEEVVAPIKVN